MSVLGTAAYAPLSHAMVENPYAVYIALRADQPVFWYEALGTWVVLDYRSCVDVLRDNNRFARDWRRVGAEVPPTDLSLQNIDPPELHPMRSVVLEAMDVHDQERLRAHLTDVAAARSWQLKDAGPYDYIREIAAPLTLSLTALLLGSSIDRVDDVADIADDIVLSMDAGLDPTRAERGRRAKTSLNQLLRSWLADSTDSGMLAEITRRSDKAGLSTDLAFNTLRVVFASIFVATTGAIGNSVLALLENPDAMAELRAGADPSIAVNELLRFDGPVHVVSRVALTDTVLRDQPIRQGDDLAVVLGSANRDPQQFTDAEHLDLRRHPNRHLGFSWGPHACLGPDLARDAVFAACAALAADDRALTLAQAPTRLPTATMRRLSSLPVASRRHG
jgi:cytochrome P450